MAPYFSKPRHLGKLLSTAALSAALLLTGCNDTAEPGMDYSKHINRGESYLKQGQFSAAIIEAQNAIQKAPEEVTTHLFLARILLEMGQAKAALNQLEQASDDMTPAYLFTKAQAFNDLNKFISAEKLLTKHQTLLTAADNNRYLKLSAGSQLGQRNIDQAQALLQQLQQNSPQDADVLVSLATAAAMQENAELSQQYLTQALELSPDNTNALLLKARIQYSSNQLSAAEDTLTIALSTLPTTDRITPQRATILGTLANILTQQGRSTEALIYTRILAEALPGQSELKSKFEQALSLLKEEKLAEAEVLLEEVIAAAPGYEAAGQLLGLIKYNRGDLEAANQYFVDSIDPEVAPENATMAFAMTNMRLNNPQKVLELLEGQIDTTQNAQLLGLYGLTALSADQAQKGEQALLKALQLDPSKSRFRLALAQLYNKQKQQQKALDQLQQGYTTTPADPFLQKALISQYLNLKQQANAEKLVKDILENHGGNENSLILVGSFQNMIGEKTKAIATMKQAVALNPKNIEAQQNLGSMLVQANQLPRATNHYRGLIQALPDETIGYKGLITALEMQKQQQPALKEVTQMAMTASGPAAYAVLAEFYARNKDFDKANDMLQSAKERFPDNTALTQLNDQLALAEGAYALSKQDFTTARNTLMTGLKTSPNNSNLQILLARTEIAAKNYREASKLTDQLAVNNGNAAMLLRGDIAAAEEKYSIALNHYQTLWENYPSDNAARRVYSAHQQLNNPANAMNFLDQWAQQLPNSGYMLLARSTEYLTSNHFDKAIADLEQLNELQGDNVAPAVLNNLAWAYLQSEQLPEALNYSEQAYNITPQSAEIADTYGWVLHKSGRHAKAKKVLAEALKLAPENKEIQAHWDVASKL